ncbi:MAG: hypothetical protein FWG33_00910 [Oscillospiraceae bacterium]|nr:hypothetical protein [Oscillospiraceae bacterium]
MTLSKNEQIAVFVLIFIVIAVAGGILFVMPQYNKISDNKIVLDSKKAEFVRLEDELGFVRFEDIEKSVIAAYEDGRSVSETFYEGEMKTYESDRLVRNILQGVNLNTDNLVINQLTTHSLMLSIFRDSDISYPIKDMATIGNAGDLADSEEGEAGTAEGGEQPAAEGESAEGGEAVSIPEPVAIAPEDSADLEAMVAYMMNAPRVGALDFYEDNMTDSQRAAYIVTAMREFLANESETVAMQSVQFEIPLTRAEAFTLSMHVYGLNNASYITGMTHRELDGETVTNADGEQVTVSAAPGGKRLYTIDMMFFIVEPMEEPNFDYATRFNWDIKIPD